MIERKTVSQCVSEDYCKGWNDAVDKMPKWISVKDSMPEHGKKVLVADDFGCVGTGECNERYVLAVKDGRLVNVLERYIYVEWGSQFGAIPNANYWMPLPEPPEEDAHEG